MDRGSKKSDPEPAPASPITFRPCSNGEFCPIPETDTDRRAEARFHEILDEHHRRSDGRLTRREFAGSACGAAAALLAINQVYGCGADSTGGPLDAGGVYDVNPEMVSDAALACQRLAGDELIVDIQVHPPSPLSPWRPAPLPTDAESLVRTIFVASDTGVACISGIPGARGGGAANVEANTQLKDLIEGIAGPRFLLHANIDPTRGASELDYMADVAARFPVAAWKVYPHVGPWRLDEGVGLGFLERARALGVKLVAAHRGIGPGVNYTATSSPVDVGNAARMFPDLRFLTYHSGWDALANENHPFNPDEPNPVGIDRLIKAVRDNGIGKDGNVYAELGSTWRNLMTQPAGAAHALGKLLVHLGEDRILWGTDSVFTGSAQEQIVAFRAFQIPQAMRDQFGYPEITPAVRAKIFGLNAAAVYGIDVEAMRCAIDSDQLSRLKTAHRADPRAVPVPTERHYGPRTRREFLAFLRWERHLAG
jgi:predicted TIM-barrel fold metal-dependent hydrolase